MKNKSKKKELNSNKPQKSSILKKWWNTYIKRLNKVTDGKPQCCK